MAIADWRGWSEETFYLERERRLCVWDVRTGREVRRSPLPVNVPYEEKKGGRDVAFGPTGKDVLVLNRKGLGALVLTSPPAKNCSGKDKREGEPIKGESSCSHSRPITGCSRCGSVRLARRSSLCRRTRARNSAKSRLPNA